MRDGRISGNPPTISRACRREKGRIVPGEATSSRWFSRVLPMGYPLAVANNAKVRWKGKFAESGGRHVESALASQSAARSRRPFVADTTRGEAGAGTPSEQSTINKRTMPMAIATATTTIQRHRREVAGPLFVDASRRSSHTQAIRGEVRFDSGSRAPLRHRRVQLPPGADRGRDPEGHRRCG